MKPSSLLLAVAASAPLGVAAPALAAPPAGPCFAAAQVEYEQYKRVEATKGVSAGPACFAESAKSWVSLEDPDKACPDRPRVVYASNRDALKGFRPVTRHDRVDVPKCREVFSAPAGQNAAPTPPKAPPNRTGAPAEPATPATAQPAEGVEAAQEKNLRLQRLKDMERETNAVALVNERPALAPELRESDDNRGEMTGGVLTDAAAEALQILGQIVVDRASQSAYRVLGDKVRAGLACGDGRKPNAAAPFPATCQALLTLRVQDVAMSRDVLVRALASDVLGRALKEYAPPAGGRVYRALLPGVRAGAVGALSGAGAQRKGAMARAAVDEMRSLAQSATAAKTLLDEVEPEFKPIVLAAAAVTACELHVAVDRLPRLSACDVSREVDRLAAEATWAEATNETRGPAVARSLARSMQLALDGHVADAGGEPAGTQRAVAALAGVFDATCYAVDRSEALGCPAILDVAADQTLAKSVEPLAVARGVLEAALEQDTNRLIASVGRGLDLVATLRGKDEAETRGRRRALRLIGGLAQYAQTFAEAGETNEEKHERRTKVLESLAADMTDRNGREGDLIWSIGGSLAFTAGGRVPGIGGEGRAVFNGPLALTLGGALHKVPERGPGLHLEFGAVDLAQYLSFRRETESGEGVEGGGKTVVVRKPKVPDALAPSIKVGVQWGREVPLYFAGYVQYAPFYEFEKDDGSLDRHGAFVVGVAAGAYVPFFDAN